MSDDKTGKDHLKESKKHLEKGTQKFLEEGERKFGYYQENRDELIHNLTRRMGNPKKPAVAGAIVLAPLIAVLYVIGWLFEKTSNIPGDRYFQIAQLIGFNSPFNFYINQTFKTAVIVAFAMLLFAGAGRLARTDLGFRFEKWVDSVFDRIPIIGTIYNISKITTETVLGGAEDLRKPVKIEFNGMRVTAFKTGNITDDGREILFLPTSPNITTGMVIEIDPNRVIETDETSEEALVRVLSAGFGDSSRKGMANGEKLDE